MKYHEYLLSSLTDSIHFLISHIDPFWSNHSWLHFLGGGAVHGVHGIHQSDQKDHAEYGIGTLHFTKITKVGVIHLDTLGICWYLLLILVQKSTEIIYRDP